MEVDQTFSNVDFSASALAAAYEDCQFTACHFAGADLSHRRFVGCSFTGCDLSNASLHQTSFSDCRFTESKLLGLRFEDCSGFVFTVSFQACTLNFSSFYKRNLKKTQFAACVLHEVDFTEANLTEAVFAGSDLHKAVFQNTVLKGADFRGAINFEIDPARNNLHGAKFDRQHLEGLLRQHGLKLY